MKTAKQIAIWNGLDNHPELEDCITAMDEYANQYLDLLINIIKAREGAQTTQDLFAVLKEIELAITILKQKA